MVVFNRNRTTALAVRRTSSAVLLIIMRSGKLSTSYVKHAEFQAEWREMSASLDRAIVKFTKHAEQNGATHAAHNALKKIANAQKTASLRLF